MTNVVHIVCDENLHYSSFNSIDDTHYSLLNFIIHFLKLNVTFYFHPYFYKEERPSDVIEGSQSAFYPSFTSGSILTGIAFIDASEAI